MSYPRQSILFISNLDKSVNETLLYQLFNEFPVSYIKIAKDHVTRESYGYAFVGFKNHSKAEEAIIKLNYSKVLKKSIRLSWYNREPNNYRNMPDYNIFVKKIHKDVKPKEFHDFFSKYGNIVSAKLVEDEDGETVGYGFVLYDNSESAKKAIAESNGFNWKGKKIYVGQFMKNRPRKIPQFNTVYVRNLAKNLSIDQIKALFSSYGEILSVFVKETDYKLLEKLPEEKRKYILEHQFAFITFKDPNSASRVVNEVPYLKQNNKTYNEDLRKLVEAIRKSAQIEDRHYYRFASYILEENSQNWLSVVNNTNTFNELVESFKKHLSENDDNYIVRDKNDRIECCQALKKRERVKRLRALYERIKKQIREKYKFCNLYVKNLPDTFDEDQLRQLFSKYGEIKSCRTCKKELTPSMIGVIRSVKLYGFVCFADPSQAREAKTSLHNQSVFKHSGKLFVDYFQSKKEREEYLKLKMINNNQKAIQKGQFVESPFPQMMSQFGPGAGLRQFPVFGHNMLRKFPLNGPMMSPQQQMPPFLQPNMNQMNMVPDINQMDMNTKRDFFGERLFNKISVNPSFTKFQDLHSKIIGIFLDLEDNMIMKLIQDDAFFTNQVIDTVRQLRERNGGN